MNKFDVILGYNCNYRCTHCGNDSIPGRVSDDLDAEDKVTIKSFIQAKSPETIAFAGGEPTLYLPLINEIISYYDGIRTPKVQIVTNGWFGSSVSKIESVLNNINHLSKVNMSFDIFHNSSSGLDNVKNIYNFCMNQGLEFQLMVSVTSPLELLKIQDLVAEIKIHATVQEVIKVGRAETNKISYHYPKFQTSTLDKKCPSEGRLVYLPKRGFSTCCSSLVFNPIFKNEKSFYNKNLDQYLESDFYQSMATKTFNEIALEKKVPVNDLAPELSHSCHLCNYLFSKSLNLSPSSGG